LFERFLIKGPLPEMKEADMNTTSGTTATTLLTLVLIATALPAQQITAPTQTSTSDAAAAPVTTGPESTPVRANSKVRIVRLSEVKGAVQMDRNTGRGFETATANLPIVEGTRLQTGTGVAEVEFEDNSSLRVTPDSLVEFPQLELLPTGAKASTVNVLKGMAYVSLADTKGNEFTLIFGQQKVHLQPSSHIRLQLEPTSAKLAVLDGTAQVEGPSGTTEVGKKKTLTFDLANQSQPEVAKNVAPDQFDSWDHNAADYHKRYASLSAFGNSPYSYGASDMLYYGSFTNVAGCGSMWRPYFVSAAWDPFANGSWAWYPNAGYSWVSPYPWGWMPYHYGSWVSCGGAGWGWQPGGAWNGLNNVPLSTATNGQSFRFPRPPVKPPVVGQPTLVPVNLKPLTASNLGSPETFVFRNDSAGMGIPRGSLGKLDKFSEQAAQHGAVSTAVYSSLPATGQNNVRTANTGLGSSSSRPGYANPSGTGASSMSPNSSGGSRISGAPSLGPGPASTAGPAGGSSRAH
jgi:FecR protein